MPAHHSIFDPPEETPPGLDAIRAWLRKPRPRLRGLWIWVRWILSRIAKAFRYLKKNWPATRKRIASIASEGEKVARLTVRVGHAARDLGGGIVRGTRALRGPDGKVSGAVARVRQLGRGVREFGGRMTEGGSGVAAAFSSIERLTRIVREERQRGLGLLDPPEGPEPEEAEPEADETPGRLLPRRPRRKSSAGGADGQGGSTPEEPKPVVDPPTPQKDPPPPDPPAREPTLTDGVKQEDEGFEGLPPEFIPEAKAARIRPPEGEALQILILEICRRRDWTTPKQLAGWFDMHRRSLSNRHIQPLVKARLLERKFPDSPNSPRQAYRTRRSDAAEPDAGDGQPAA